MLRRAVRALARLRRGRARRDLEQLAETRVPPPAVMEVSGVCCQASCSNDVGAPVSLTGRYSAQGAQVRAGLNLWAAHAGAKLVLLDDASDPGQACRLHEKLVRRGCRLVLGPYGSDSTRAVARAP